MSARVWRGVGRVAAATLAGVGVLALSAGVVLVAFVGGLVGAMWRGQ